MNWVERQLDTTVECTKDYNSQGGQSKVNPTFRTFISHLGNFSDQHLSNQIKRTLLVLYAHEECPMEEGEIQSRYQVVVAQVLLRNITLVTVVNFYISGSTDIEDGTLKAAIHALPKPCIILGNFNTHKQFVGRQENNITRLRTPADFSGLQNVRLKYRMSYMCIWFSNLSKQTLAKYHNKLFLESVLICAQQGPLSRHCYQWGTCS